MKRVLITVVVIAGLLAAGFCGYQLTTPRHALVKTVADVRRFGAEGLEQHLTGNARQVFDAVEALSDNQWISGIISGLSQTDGAALLKSKLAELDWEVEDILSGKQSSEVVMRFSDEDGLSGTITITMVREDGAWKIDGFKLPHFDLQPGTEGSP